MDILDNWLIRRRRGRAHAKKRIENFYALSDVRRLLEARTHPVLEIPSRAFSGVIVTLEGEEWGDLWALTRFFRAPYSLMERCLAEVHVPYRFGRGQLPRLEGDRKNDLFATSPFFVLREVQEAWATFVGRFPAVGVEGTFQEITETYGTPEALGRLFSISPATVRARAKKAKIKKRLVQGKRRVKGIPLLVDCFPLAALENVCSEIREKLPQLDAKGGVTEGDERWETIAALARRLRKTEALIRSLARKGGIRSLRCEGYHRRRHTCYAVADVSEQLKGHEGRQ